jgi:hypothetical protein
MSLLIRFLIVVTVVVSITDAIVFYKISQHPERLTVLFVIMVILVTVIPIAIITINLWYRANRSIR